MPTYTYECLKCGYQFDYFHSITSSPKVVCERCKGKCQRLIGNGAGIIFKGSGFYETDYKRKNNNGNGHGHKSSSSTDGNGKTSSTETKTTESKSTVKETVSK